MAQTLDSAHLKSLPAWKSLEEAKQQKLRYLELAIQEKEAALMDLANEVPRNGGGMVFGAGNESLDLEQQFTRSKEAIKALREALGKTICIDTRVVKAPGRACHGSLVVVRNLKSPAQWSQRVFRLVLLNEQPEAAAAMIEHVELGSPLGMALLGIAQGEDFKLGLGSNQVLAEVEEVI